MDHYSIIDRYAGRKIKVWNIGDALSMLQQVSAVVGGHSR